MRYRSGHSIATRIQTSRTNMKKNVTLTTSSASGVLAADKLPEIVFETTKSEKSLKGGINFTRMRPSLWDAAEMLQAFAGFIAVLYLLGAVALGVALLFYTFTR